MKSLNYFYTAINVLAVTSMAVFVMSCDDNDPVKEDTPELITKAVLTFSPEGGGEPVVVSATDPDGEGVQELVIEGTITLLPNTTYNLSIQLLNELADPGTEGYDISEEVSEEANEHLFYFAWTGNVFSDPSGNGNIDNRSDDVNYLDEDQGGLPLGLQTQWTTAASGSGEFSVILKHQPKLKTATSSSTDGETDLDVTWAIAIE